jgi:type VI secretion system protein ImpH
MAATRGGSTADLRTWLDETGTRLRFFQAVRMLQQAHPDRAAVGTGDDPRREAIRMRGLVSLSFPPSEVTDLEAGDRDEPARLTAAFMGLANPHSFGSLPVVYTERLLAAKRQGDSSLADFLAIFDHRLLSLFYRAWEACRYPVAYERSGPGKAGSFENAMLCLIGLAPGAQRRRLPVSDLSLIARADVFAGGGATPRSLAGLLAEQFEVPVTVQSFVPGWFVLETAERSRLGREACTLARDLVLGARVQLAQSRFRVRLGPLPARLFQELLPGQPGADALATLIRLAAGSEHDFDYQLVLNRDEVPRLGLQRRPGPEAARLGWNTWLHTRPMPHDPDDVIVNHEPDAVAAAS